MPEISRLAIGYEVRYNRRQCVPPSIYRLVEVCYAHLYLSV